MDIALEFQDNGVENLHIVDLDGADQIKFIILKSSRRLLEKQILIQFGGEKSDKQIEIAFESG